MIGGRQPLVPEILSQSDRAGAKFEQAAITPKRYEIEYQLLLITNRKSHTGFRLVPTSMTLNAILALFVFFHRIRCFHAHNITVVEARPAWPTPF